VAADIEIVMGVPGSGKTTYLLNKLQSFVDQGYALEEISYVSFTKKATSEALWRYTSMINGIRDRVEKTGAFRTIHSRAFRSLGLSSKNVIDSFKLRDFAHASGFRVYKMYNEDMVNQLAGDDKNLYALDQLYRANAKKISAHMHKLDGAFSKRFTDYMREYRRFKKTLNYYDYTDILEMYVEQGKIEKNIKVAIIDEAQDLSPLQWRVVLNMYKGAKHILVGGDEQQAIYGHAGAATEMMLQLRGRATFLEQSYRCPPPITERCNYLGKLMTVKSGKKMIPTKKRGYYTWLEDIGLYQMPKEGTVYLLGRTSCQVKALTAWCESRGILYRTATKQYPILTKADETLIRNGYDHLMDTPEKRYLCRAAQTTGYLKSTLADERTGLRRVYVGTIHSVKGGEADHVVCPIDTTPACDKSMQIDPETEHKVFYVALSRARIGITLLRESSPFNYNYLPRRHYETDETGSWVSPTY
jgi:superfamily I DNA/RNA helicase